jgi:hypothetical protein
MPIKKGKSKSTPKSTKHKNIVDIINRLSRSKHSFRKSQNNLPARLMKLNSPKIVQAYKNTHISSKGKSLIPNTHSFNKSKSMSSSYSSFTENGKTYSEGKTIINNSTKPFIEITEMENGKTERFMIPKHTIPYKSIKSKSMKSKTIKSKSMKSKTIKAKSNKAKSTKAKTTKRKSIKEKSTKEKSTKAKSTKSSKRK